MLRSGPIWPVLPNTYESIKIGQYPYLSRLFSSYFILEFSAMQSLVSHGGDLGSALGQSCGIYGGESGNEAGLF
jgi:hypothetical protein